VSGDERIARIQLDEASILRRAAEVEHERATALADLLRENSFSPHGVSAGPYEVFLSVRENRLRFEIRAERLAEPLNVVVPLAPFRGIIRDYFLICESYFEAVKAANNYKVEAVDMGRRGVHNEGSELLLTMLEGKISLDFETARRLFTLICVLHIK
jgi:uncharacterized protein (UPF0262 family)